MAAFKQLYTMRIGAPAFAASYDNVGEARHGTQEERTGKVITSKTESIDSATVQTRIRSL
jgi:hypothetical protein